MGPKEKLLALQKQMRAIVDGAKASGRDLTDEEITDLETKSTEATELKATIERQEKGAALIASITEVADEVEEQPGGGREDKPKSLGEHFAKSVGANGFARFKSGDVKTIAAPEFKAATDPHLVPGAFAPLLTQVDQGIVRAYRRPLVSDLFSTGTISGNAVTYFVEGAVEGAFATVAEGGQKPQMHIGDPTAVTDSLKKIAAWWDTSDEMIEDVAFWESEVNNRGLYLLSLFEEQQLLSGNGTGSNILGVLNRSGVQTETQAATGDSAQDAIFRAITKVQTATGLTADGIVINPADYQALRLSKDANGQYFGGGFFSGEYGNGGVTMQPSLWGLRTVVSSAVPAKTVAVGAFQAAATVYRKGGIRVESTNSDLGKFTKNIVTTRIEERVALAVRIPAAVVKTTLV